jgi:hypothetical protein
LAPDTDALRFDDTVRLAGFAKRRRRDVVNGNAGRSLTIENALVGVPVKHCVNTEPINRLSNRLEPSRYSIGCGVDAGFGLDWAGTGEDAGDGAADLLEIFVLASSSTVFSSG